MLRLPHLCLSLALVSLAGASPQGTTSLPPGNPAPPQGFNRAPVLSLEGASGSGDTVLLVGETLRVTLRAHDREGQGVSLRLLNPPPRSHFDPSDGGSTVEATLTWLATQEYGGARRLVFEATDNATPPLSSRLHLDLRVEGQVKHTGIAVGDVTGDGVLDVVAISRLADTGAISNTGRAFVWAGTSTPIGTPSATLEVPGAVADDRLGQVTGQGLQLADVDGDDVLDVIIGSSVADPGGVFGAGAIYVWKGGAGLAGVSAPFATLVAPNAGQGFFLGAGAGLAIVLADLVGDGTRDIIACASSASAGPGLPRAGRVVIWEGGPGLAGSPAARASVRRPDAHGEDSFGWLIAPFSTLSFSQGVRVADVTGDGRPDLIVGCSRADRGGLRDVGEIVVWKGGPSLSGNNPAATAVLSNPSAAENDSMGGSAEGIRFADLTGDGVLDIFTSSGRAGGQTGRFYVFAGGSSLTGAVAPHATLRATTATPTGPLILPGGAQLADLDQDGITDVIGGSTRSFDGAGAHYLWSGGPTLVGDVTETATFLDPATHRYSSLGVQGFHLADVTGDGELDLISATPLARSSGVQNAGAIFVWEGAPGLSGIVSFTARGRVETPSENDNVPSRGLYVEDLTGDGIADILAVSDRVDMGNVENVGAAYLWHGGNGLRGAKCEDATLSAPSAVALGLIGTPSFPVVTGDVTGDGVRDVVIASSLARPDVMTDAGAFYLWAGGNQLSGAPAPTATLFHSGAGFSEYLGSGSGQVLQLADANGDGTLDVVSQSYRASLGQNALLGALFVWLGGPGLLGDADADQVHQVPGAAFGDELGRLSEGQGLVLADVTGDGDLELVAGADQARVDGFLEAGAVYVFPGSESGAVTPLVRLASPDAAEGDELGH